MTQHSPEANTPLSWQSLDSYDHERNQKWYITGGLFLLGFLTFGILEQSFSTVCVGVLIGGLYFLLRKHRAVTVDIVIDGLGIRRGETLHPWNTLQDFWIVVPQIGRAHV